MHRFILTAALCLLALAASPAWAGVTGARVVSIGEMGRSVPENGAQPGIEGRPGIRFGMELVPEGTPQGAPVVLEARLKRPDDPEKGPPMRWLVAARIAVPVLSEWEFAYDWEVEPGVWTMTVSHEDTVLATASFTVLQPDPQAPPQTPPLSQPSPRPAKQGEPRQDKKTSDSAPAKSQADTAAPLPKSGDAKASAGKQPEVQKPETSKPDAAKPEAPRPEPPNPVAPRQEASPPPVAKQPAPAKPMAPPPAQDRPPKPLAEVQGQTQDTPKAVTDAPGRKVQVLVAGVYSEEARALWVAAFLKKRGVKACVRVEDRGGKRRWSLVAGWRDTLEEARRAKDELTPAVGDIVIVSMGATELEKGLQCR